jgi:hypothetical protein
VIASGQLIADGGMRARSFSNALRHDRLPNADKKNRERVAANPDLNRKRLA